MAENEASYIGKVAVLGAGTMGHGIAQVCAMSGHETVLFDVSEQALSRAQAHVEANLAKGVDKGKVTDALRQQTLARFVTTERLHDAAYGADIVIEAVPERMDLKVNVLREAHTVAPLAILATNTSSLSIQALAQALPVPGQVIGTHFFNPVHIMKLLEVVKAPQTSADVLARVLAFGRGLGKECIVIADSPGFATSRLGLVIGLEAIRMVEEGVGSPEDIDKAMTLGYGFPMGPLRLTDLVGLDVRLHIARYLSEHLPQGAHFKPPALLGEMVAAGKLGKKSGEGFYKW